MDYGEVFTSAWRIIWKHKVLWLFGILAGCGATSGSSNGGISYQFSNPDFGLEFYKPLPAWQVSLIIALAVAVVLLLIVLVIFLGTIGRIGLIRGAREADRGAETMTFGSVFRGSRPFFWRVFLLNLAFLLAIAILAILIGIFALLATVFTLGLALICILPLLCLLVPVYWAISIYLEQANIALVVEDLTIGRAFRQGWDVFSKNLGVMILVGIFLALVTGVTGFLLGMPIAIGAIPLIRAFASDGGGNYNAGLVAGICIIIYLPFLLVLAGVVRSYIGSAWTLTYLRLTNKAIVQ
jgi:hypothetical protein